MVGIKKLVLDLDEFRTKKGKAQLTDLKNQPYLRLDKLLREFSIVEFHGEGSKLHGKLGLSKDKVLIRTQRRRETSPKPHPQEPSKSSVQTEAQPQEGEQHNE